MVKAIPVVRYTISNVNAKYSINLHSKLTLISYMSLMKDQMKNSKTSTLILI